MRRQQGLQLDRRELFIRGPKWSDSWGSKLLKGDQVFRDAKWDSNLAKGVPVTVIQGRKTRIRAQNVAVTGVGV